ncbi:MAG TPA: alpha/beta fold hydrolase [Saprospiraceae bacterium]|nr:alpha/beta fold hydrolase [Saprospiraceae bacterium]
MPIINPKLYKPSWWVKNGHINTIAPYVLRKNTGFPFQRNRLTTFDGDFIDVDTQFRRKEKLAILCHGLEGSSSSQYIIHSAQLLAAHGWDIAAMNYRACSGEINLKPVMYHSGFTDDLHAVVMKYQSIYNHISLIGFSLGGNLVLKYAGDGIFTLPEPIQSIVAISVPCDLASSARKIARWYNYLYEKRFLNSLLSKAILKHRQYPDIYLSPSSVKIDGLYAFDNLYTAPVHGFENADDYYNKCSSRQFIQNISIPTLIINAKDDPFLAYECFPYAECDTNEQVHFLDPPFGGHVGFFQHSNSPCWNEELLLHFIQVNGNIQD